MISFAALNKDDSSSVTTGQCNKGSNPTREAQESAVLQMYHAAIKKQQEGSLKEAEQIYYEVLSSSILSPVNPSSAATSNTLYRVKFLIFKNLASIAKEMDDIPRAISAYIEASQYNQDDITLYYQLALSCTLLGDMSIARNALEQVLHINPRYWPAFDLLCKVLLAIEDYYACIDAALATLEFNPQNKIAIGIIQHCIQICPESVSINPLLTKYIVAPKCPESNYLIDESRELSIKYKALNGVCVLLETIVPPCKLFNFSIESLGQFLIAVYNHCQDISRQYAQPSLSVSVDLYKVLEGVNDEASSLEVLIPQTDIAIKDYTGDCERRKRRLFSDSESEYQPKRRSTRSRASVIGGIRREHQDYLAVVNKYLPPIYRLVSLPEASELIEVYDDGCKASSILIDDVDSCVLDEVHEVRQFIEKRIENRGIISLLIDFLYLLSTKCYLKWSKKNNLAIKKLFSQCFDFAYRHFPFPTYFSDLSEFQKKEAWKFFNISLCYAEITLDSVFGEISLSKRVFVKSTSSISKHLPVLFPKCMIYVQYMCPNIHGIDDGKEKVTSAVRVEWIKIKICLLEKDFEAAVAVIDKCLEIFKDNKLSHERISQNQNLVINLPNCSSDNVISTRILTEKKNAIIQMISLKKVFCMYRDKDYNKVIDTLIPVLKQESGSHSKFFITLFNEDTSPTDDQPGIQLLLESLLSTSRIKEAFEFCVQSVHEILNYYATHGASDSLTNALAYHFDVLLRCFKHDSCILPTLQYKVVQNFITIMIKVLDLTQDSIDTFTLPNTIYIQPWLLLHKVVSCENLPVFGSESHSTSSVSNSNTFKTGLNTSVTMKTIQCIDNVNEPTMDSNSCVNQSNDDEEMMMETSVIKEHVVHVREMDTNDETPLPFNVTPTSETSQAVNETPTNTSNLFTSPHSVSVKEYSPSTPAEDPLATPTTSISPLINISYPFKSQTDSPVLDGKCQKEISLKFLQQAHSLLGCTGWCTKDDGNFLEYFVSLLCHELRELTALSKDFREVLLVELEQCYYCMYGYPYKKAKSRGLVEHNADQIPLTWDRSRLLLEYFHPSYLPCIDDSKSTIITNELISLYKKIVDSLPTTGQVISLSSIVDYIESSSCTLPQLCEPDQNSSLIGEIYYVLADDSLRSCDNQNAIRYYKHCLSYNPSSFNSWAGIAIAMSQRITDKIDKRDSKVTFEKFVEKKTPLVIRCFDKALELTSDHCFVLEKYGFFLYTIHSFVAQIIKQPLVYKSKHVQEWATIYLKKMLTLSEEKFKHALSLEGYKHHEPWVYQFMLGKISAKLNRSPQIILDYFIKCTDTLHSEGSAYPVYIEVTSKGHSIQALEVHYQFMSTLLKLLLNCSSTDVSTANYLPDAIENIRYYPLGRITYQALWDWATYIISLYNMKTARKVNTDEPNKQKNNESTPQHSSYNTHSVVSESDISVITDTINISPLPAVSEESNNNDAIKFDKLPISPRKSDIEEELIIVDEGSSHDSCDSLYVNESNAIELIAQDAKTSTGLDPIPRFSRQSPDPLTEAVYGVAMCAVKFPAYFKPLYRLAKTLNTMGYPYEAKLFLLGPIPKCFTDIQEKLVPIFVLKSNIYQNMWQIQISEMNRPGNFSSHATSCLQLLIDVLVATRDLSSLLYITQQLKMKVDPSKQFMKEYDRQVMYTKSLVRCVMLLKTLSSIQSDISDINKILIEAYSVRTMILKATITDKEEHMKELENSMMKFFIAEWKNNVQIFEELFPGKNVDNINILELCLKYCQTQSKS